MAPDSRVQRAACEGGKAQTVRPAANADASARDFHETENSVTGELPGP